MPVCPECRAEYRKGFDHCPTCDVDLVDEYELPDLMTDEEVIASMAEEDLMPIIRGSVEGCRETQRTLLEQRIPAVIHEAKDIVAEAGHFRILQVVVRKEDAERAQMVLNQEWVDNAQHEGLLRDVALVVPDDQSAGEGEDQDDEDQDNEQPACPACGCTKPLKKGKCRDCGLHLG
jgi:hypothetical protein